MAHNKPFESQTVASVASSAKAAVGRNATAVAVAGEADPFHWNLFPEFDSISKHHCALLRIPVLDMAPLYLRPDAHPSMNKVLMHKLTDYDCLHYCLPGPLDIFAQILLTMLLNQEV